MPSKISELAKRGIFYTPLETTAPEQAEEDGDFMRGLKKAGHQIPQTAGGAVALVGDLVGSDGMREYGMDVYQKRAEQIEAISKPTDSLSSVLEGAEDTSAADWLQNSAGYVTGQVGTALVTGGVGGFIGKQLAKRGISHIIERGTTSAAAKQVAEKVATRGARAGALSGIMGLNLMQEAGSIYPDAVHVAEAEGRELTGADKARVVGSSVVAAGVDTAMDALMLGRVMVGGRKAGESMVKAAGRELPLAMGREGVTEGIQSGIERYGAGKELTTADAVREYVDSVGVGMVGGGMGGALSVLHSQKVPDGGPLSRAANIATDQEIAEIATDPQPVVELADGSTTDKASLAVYLKQFETPELRTAKQRELLGLDPKTGEKLAPEPVEPAPEPEFAATPDEEQVKLSEWAAEHEPATLDYVHSLLAAPGMKGKKMMVAPHPDGGGYTVVPANWLTLDTQATLGELQKPAPKGKEGEKAAAKPEPAAAPAPTAEVKTAAKLPWEGFKSGLEWVPVFEEQVADNNTDKTEKNLAKFNTLNAHIAEAVKRGVPVPIAAKIAAAAYRREAIEFKTRANARRGISDPVVVDEVTPIPKEPVAEAAPAEPEWKTNSYTAYKFADLARAEQFMVNKKADPALFEIQPAGDLFVIKRKPTQGERNDSGLAAVHQDGSAGRDSGSGTAAGPAGIDGIGAGPVDGAVEQREPALGLAGQVAEPDPVHATGSADAKPALIREQIPSKFIEDGHDIDVDARAWKMNTVDAVREAVDLVGESEIHRLVDERSARAASGTLGPELEAAVSLELVARKVVDFYDRNSGSADADPALISEAAHEAATSPLNALADPTPAQAKAGNYKKGRVKLHGLDFAIENPAGSVRKGVSPDGKAWENKLEHHYGDISGTKGADGDAVDAFIGPNPASARVFVVDQVDPATGKFDEHKALFGFDSMEEARAGYAANYEAGWQGGKDVSETSVEGFKAWLNEGDTTKPYSTQQPQGERNGRSKDNGIDGSAGGLPEREGHSVREEIGRQDAGGLGGSASTKAVAKHAASATADTGDGIPKAFYKKVKVSHDVYAEDVGDVKTEEVPADQALKAVREDIDNLQALLKCMKGGA